MYLQLLALSHCIAHHVGFFLGFPPEKESKFYAHAAGTETTITLALISF